MSVNRRALGVSGACLLALFHLAVLPTEGTAEHLQAFFDRWNTLRKEVDNQGLTLETVNTTDILTNASGGLRNRTAIAGDLDLLLTVDAERLAGWPDATFFVYGLGLYGEDPSRDIGDAQTVSSIAAPTTWRLFEAWYQQNFLADRVSVLGGLYDITSEFNVIRASSELFVNSSFGTNPEFASLGRNGLSTFPFTALGLRGQVALKDNLTLRAVVADGVPGDPGDPNGTDLILKSEDGDRAGILPSRATRRGAWPWCGAGRTPTPATLSPHRPGGRIGLSRKIRDRRLGADNGAQRPQRSRQQREPGEA